LQFPQEDKPLTSTQVAGHLQVKQQQDAPTLKTRCGHAWIKGWEIKNPNLQEIGMFALLTFPATQKPTDHSKNKINQHLSRLYPQIVGPQKRK
jgi:hypothetical protein